MSEAASVLTRLQEEGFRTLDLRFTDLSGRWCHTSIEAQSVTEEALARGILIDGASVPGWRDVADSDLLLHPDLATAWADPFSAQPTLVLYCDGLEPAAAMDYERDPRCTARRAERAQGSRLLRQAAGQCRDRVLHVRRRAGRTGSDAQFLQPRIQ